MMMILCKKHNTLRNMPWALKKQQQQQQHIQDIVKFSCFQLYSVIMTAILTNYMAGILDEVYDKNSYLILWLALQCIENVHCTPPTASRLHEVVLVCDRVREHNIDWSTG